MKLPPELLDKWKKLDTSVLDDLPPHVREFFLRHVKPQLGKPAEQFKEGF